MKRNVLGKLTYINSNHDRYYKDLENNRELSLTPFKAKNWVQRFLSVFLQFKIQHFLCIMKNVSTELTVVYIRPWSLLSPKVLTKSQKYIILDNMPYFAFQWPLQYEGGRRFTVDVSYPMRTVPYSLGLEPTQRNSFCGNIRAAPGS
jgi:hypothetical protein